MPINFTREARFRHDPGVGREDPVHVGVDLAHIGPKRARDRHCGRIRAASAERRDVAGCPHPLEARDHANRARVEHRVDPVAVDLLDPRA